MDRRIGSPKSDRLALIEPAAVQGSGSIAAAVGMQTVQRLTEPPLGDRCTCLYLLS